MARRTETGAAAVGDSTAKREMAGERMPVVETAMRAGRMQRAMRQRCNAAADHEDGKEKHKVTEPD
jgi:hypothetical protein